MDLSRAMWVSGRPIVFRDLGSLARGELYGPMEGSIDNDHGWMEGQVNYRWYVLLVLWIREIIEDLKELDIAQYKF